MPKERILSLQNCSKIHLHHDKVTIKQVPTAFGLSAPQKELQLALLESLKVGIWVFFNLSLTVAYIGGEQRDYLKICFALFFFCHKGRDENVIKKLE